MAARYLAILALALGLVLMHHAVIAVPPATATTSVEHGHSAHRPAPAPDGHHGDHQGAMTLHLCLAVLAALGVLVLVAPHTGHRPAPDGDPDDAPARVAPAPARPPPVPLRLARLQVLRL